MSSPFHGKPGLVAAVGAAAVLAAVYSLWRMRNARAAASSPTSPSVAAAASCKLEGASSSAHACQVQVLESEKTVGEEMARVVIELVQRKKDARILFQTGTTPIRSGFFAALQQARAAGAVDFSAMRVVGGDEYAGVPLTEPGSFAIYLMKHVVKPLGVVEANVLLLDGGAKDTDAECARFEASLRAHPLDLCILGLGLNGHVAFNDPPSPADSITRLVKLAPESVTASKGDLTQRSVELLPTHALSIGMATIRECSHQVYVLAPGASKADILQRVLQGPVSADVPASQLRSSPHVRFLVDKAAAARL